jgi:Fur family zinc uptake transcriptional regulator
MSLPLDPHDHGRCTADLMDRAERTCLRRGTRLTGQRRDVLACVGESHAAVGAYDIIERMAARGPRPAPITIYRALDFLMGHGLIHKIESRNAYVACSHAHDGAPAALMLCSACGTVAELDAAAAADLLRAGAAAQGFAPARLVIEMTGLCRACGGRH